MHKTKMFLTATAVYLLSAAAQAASILPSDINTTFADAKADMLTVVGLAITLLLVVVGWRNIKRVL